MKIKTINLKTLLTSRSLRSYVSTFFRKYKAKSQFISILIKLSADKGNIIYSLSNKVTLNITNMEDKTRYLDLINNQFNIYDEKYHDEITDKVLICYIESDRNEYRKYVRNLALSKKYELDIENGIQPIKNIPLNTNYKGWGKVIPSGTAAGVYEIKNPNFDSNIESISVKPVNYKSTDFTVYYKGNKEILLFNDTLTKTDKFKRSFNSGEIIFFDQNNPFFMFNDNIGKPKYELDSEGNPKLIKDEDGNLTTNRLDIIKPFKKPKLNKMPSKEEMDIDENDPLEIIRPKFNITTFDIETYLEDNVFKILAICFGRAHFQNQFYIADYPTVDDLLKAAFDKLFTKEFNRTHLYIHNGSKFDLIFLVKYLLSRSDITINPIYKDGKFISLNIKYGADEKGNYQYSLNIRDSMLLLLSSLSKLGKAFNVEIQKDVFPYYFPNKDNLNYKGDVPAYEFFDSSKVTLEDYNEYVKRFQDRKWSLKYETLNYCSRDCMSLYQILKSFCNLIFDKFEVNVLKAPTLPSLAFRIFRSKFLPKSLEIPLLSRRVYNDLVQGYFGGHVDMYIPKGPIYPQGKDVSVNKFKLLNIAKMVTHTSIDFIKTLFKTVKHYDINSLYPSVMLKYKYPTDIIGYFIGDITLIQDYAHLYKNNFGFYKVKVEAPDSIKHPLLPIRNQGTCIFPTGTWTGWYFSEEIKNCEKYGYQFEILGGYIFKSDFIFKEYIEELNLIKESSEKGSAMYLISKILMNSLYGRFGLNPFLSRHYFVTKEGYEEYMKNNHSKIADSIDFGSHYLVAENSSEDLDSTGHLANVAIASAITSYSRIVMSQFKNRDDITLFYSDTDSLITDSYLPEDVVNNKTIGLYKLEDEYLLFIGIGPKVYGAIDIYGNSYTKIKGYKNEVDLDILEKLLNLDSIHELIQSKWFKKVADSDITIKVSPYQLKPNDNKRLLIYTNNLLTNTRNLSISNGKIST